MTFQTYFIALAPEILLVAAAVLCFIIGLSRHRILRDLVPVASLLGLMAAMWSVTAYRMDDVEILPPGVIHDSLLWYVRIIVCLAGVLIVLVNRHVPSADSIGEYFGLILLSLAGISLVAAADDLLLFFLALELVSVPTYVLIGLSRSHAAAQEATVKYFFLGAFASAITLYGLSFLYGSAGSTAMVNPDDAGRSIRALLMGHASGGLVKVGMALTIAGLAFKIAAVPLHFYVADVYHGAAAPVSGLLGFVPKLAGFVGLIRIFDLTSWAIDDSLFWLLWIMAAATMTVGNTLALMQRENVKRVLAYSSVAHSGYMLVALLAGPGGAVGSSLESPLRSGLAALLFYMMIYGVTNLGAFAALAYLRARQTGEPVETFDELSAAARRRPAAALALAVCAVGLMGLPPTAGLLGKLYLFSSALSVPVNSPHRLAMIVLVIVGVLNAAVAAAYYLRIAAACLMGPDDDKADETPPTPCDALRLGLAACAAFVLLVFFRPGPLMQMARHAAEPFLASPTLRATRAAAPDDQRASSHARPEYFSTNAPAARSSASDHSPGSNVQPVNAASDDAIRRAAAR